MHSFLKLIQRLETFSDYKYYVRFKNIRSMHEKTSYDEFGKLYNCRYISKLTADNTITVFSNSLRFMKAIRKNEDVVVDHNLPIYSRFVFTKGEDATYGADDLIALLNSHKLLKVNDNTIATELTDEPDEDKYRLLKLTFKTFDWTSKIEEGLTKNDREK